MRKPVAKERHNSFLEVRAPFVCLRIVCQCVCVGRGSSLRYMYPNFIFDEHFLTRQIRIFILTHPKEMEENDGDDWYNLVVVCDDV